MDLEKALAQARDLRVAVKIEAALAAYKRIVEQHPDCPEGRHGLGLCLGFKGLLDGSIRELEIAAELAPLSTEILLDLAKTYLMNEMYVEGETTFGKVLKIDPDNDEAKKQLEYCREWSLKM
ncbi:MAG: hypothetical protein ACE5R4_02815 [Armatimonadota bacterium]